MKTSERTWLRFGFACFLVAVAKVASAQENNDAPSAEELQAAKAAFEQIGAKYYPQRLDPQYAGTGSDKPERHHWFLMPDSTSGTELKKVPQVPFCFALRLPGKLTGAQLLELPDRDNLHTISFAGGEVNDALLRGLKNLKHLKAIFLHQCGITEVGIKELKHLTSLEQIKLTSTNVTGHGFGELNSLSHLTTIALFQSAITDDGLAEFQALENLRILDLRCTKVTDKGMNALNKLTRLCYLDLFGTGVTDLGLKELKDLKNLQMLFPPMFGDVGLRVLRETGLLGSTNLAGGKTSRPMKIEEIESLYLANVTTVTDSGLKELKFLKNLQTLWLPSKGITDAGLKELQCLTNLKKLSLGDCKVTQAALQELQQALPNCQIGR